MWALHVRTYEVDDRGNSALVVEHVFYGTSQNRALQISRSHEKTDQFYRGCGFAESQRPANWHGITCWSEEWWERA